MQTFFLIFSITLLFVILKYKQYFEKNKFYTDERFLFKSLVLFILLLSLISVLSSFLTFLISNINPYASIPVSRLTSTIFSMSFTILNSTLSLSTTLVFTLSVFITLHYFTLLPLYLSAMFSVMLSAAFSIIPSLSLSIIATSISEIELSVSSVAIHYTVNRTLIEIILVFNAVSGFILARFAISFWKKNDRNIQSKNCIKSYFTTQQIIRLGFLLSAEFPLILLFLYVAEFKYNLIFLLILPLLIFLTLELRSALQVTYFEVFFTIVFLFLIVLFAVVISVLINVIHPFTERLPIVIFIIPVFFISIKITAPLLRPVVRKTK